MRERIIGVWFVLSLVIPAAVHSQDTTDGIIWYPPILLSDSTSNGYSPRIALSGDDTVHVTWEWGGMRVPYARSINGGRSFEPTRELLPDTALSPNPTEHPFVTASGSTVCVYFLISDPPFPHGSLVHMFRSTDGGATFASVRDISPHRSGEITWGTSLGDTIALIYPPFDSTDPFRKILRSTDGGLTWGQAAADLDWDARIALSPGSLHRVEHVAVGGVLEVEYRRSRDLGDTWDVDTMLSRNDGIPSDIPNLAAYQGKCGTELLVAWRDLEYGWSGFTGASIISREGLANGDTWLPEYLLTPSPTGTEPRVALHKSVRAVSWWNEVPNLELVFDGMVRASTSSFLNLGPPKNLAPTDGHGNAPVMIVASSHAIHVVVEGHLGGTLDTFGVFYLRGEFIPSNSGFVLSTGAVSFDTTEINSSRIDSVSVANSGSDVLVIGTASSDNENFCVLPSSASVPPGGNAVFRVIYAPKSFGPQTGKIVFYHNGDGSPDCFATSGVSKWNSVTVSYPGGWNLVSVPLYPGLHQTLPALYTYAGSYTPEDSLVFGVGYWARPASQVIYTGAKVIDSAEIPVSAGWNMIGSLSIAVAVSQITSPSPGLTISPIYEYSGTAYVEADTLHPGSGYWVRTNQAGILTLSSHSNRPKVRFAALTGTEKPPPPPGEGEVSQKSAWPKSVMLLQNYPNPFNPTTKIKYALPRPSDVSLKIYDLFGREITILVNEKEPAGEHEVEWNAESYPSGIYYAHLAATEGLGGSSVQTMKLLLLK